MFGRLCKISYIVIKVSIKKIVSFLVTDSFVSLSLLLMRGNSLGVDLGRNDKIQDYHMMKPIVALLFY